MVLQPGKQVELRPCCTAEHEKTVCQSEAQGCVVLHMRSEGRRCHFSWCTLADIRKGNFCRYFSCLCPKITLESFYCSCTFPSQITVPSTTNCPIWQCNIVPLVLYDLFHWFKTQHKGSSCFSTWTMWFAGFRIGLSVSGVLRNGKQAWICHVCYSINPKKCSNILSFILTILSIILWIMQNYYIWVTSSNLYYEILNCELDTVMLFPVDICCWNRQLNILNIFS